MWQTGEYVRPDKASSYFYIENWGDTNVGNPDNKNKAPKLVRGATKFLGTVRWDEMKAAAAEFIELPSRKRGASSRSASEVEDDPMLSDDDVFLVLSD